MTNRSDLWNLLLAREGQWIDRDNIDFVGGAEAGRRMREIRADIAKAGSFRLDERRNAKGRFEYRLQRIPVEEVAPDAPEIWRCRNCHSRVARSQTVASMDERWRLGRCPSCGERKSVFERSER